MLRKKFELHQAAALGNVDTVNQLLKENADPIAKDNEGRVPLHHVFTLPASVSTDDNLKLRKIKIANALMQAAPQALEYQDNFGQTPLFLMAMYGFDSLISYVVAKFPHVAMIPNNDGVYPLHAAINNNQQKVVRALLQLNEMRNLVDANQGTLLHCAAYANNVDAVKLILEQDGVDIHALLHATDADNVTAEQIASSSPFHQKMFELLAKMREEADDHKKNNAK